MEKAKRNSAIELLRIICMLLIISGHYTSHGGVTVNTVASLSAATVFLQCISMFARMSCAVFAMITGYFYIESRCEKHYRRIVPLVAEMFFYSISIYVILVVTGAIDFSFTGAIKAALPILFGNWYVLYYVIFFLFIPFINPYLSALDKSSYFKLLALLITVWCIIPTFTARRWQFCNLVFFFVTYAVGGYIKLFVNNNVKYKNSKNAIGALACAALMLLSVLALDGLGYVTKIELFVEKARYFGEFNTLLSFLCALFLVLFFTRLELHSRVINVIASSTLGIYLIHENDFFRPVLWQTLSPNTDFAAFPYFHAPLKILAVFVICLVIDLVKTHTLGKPLTKWFYSHCDAMTRPFKTAFDKIAAKINKNRQAHKNEDNYTPPTKLIIKALALTA